MTRGHWGPSPASPKAATILVAMVVGLVGLQPPPPVRAAVGLSPTADDTWGTEIAATGKAGRVLAVAVSGGLVYLGGDFAGLSPPGPKAASALVRRGPPSAPGRAAPPPARRRAPPRRAH